MPALLFCLPVPALLSCPGLPTPSLSCSSMPALSSCLLVPTLSSCLLMPASSSLLVPTLLSLPMPALTSPPVPASTSCSVLSLAPTWLTSSALRIFKRALSDEHLDHQSTSPSPLKSFRPFSILGLMPKKSDCERPFDIAYINSRLFAANHAAKEFELSFGKCGCPAQVKFNRSQQMELLDRKPVCIMEAIPLATALFWDLLFTLYLRHTIKLASKLELKMPSIASGLVKERIESVYANRSIHQLD